MISPQALRDGISRDKGRSGTPQRPRRVTGDRQEADRSCRLGGPDAYEQSPGLPDDHAPRRSAGMAARTCRELRIVRKCGR